MRIGKYNISDGLVIKIALVLVVVIAFVENAQIRKLSAANEALMKAAVRPGMVSELTTQALHDPYFTKALTAQDRLLWATLVTQAKESPESTRLVEWSDDGTVARIPIEVNCQDENSIAYIAVVGVHYIGKNYSEYVPRFVIYSGCQEGGVARLNMLYPVKTGEVLINGEWVSDERYPWGLHLSSAKENLAKAIMSQTS